MYALFPIRSTCYVLCRLNSNSRMHFTLKLHEVSPCPCPYPCLEGLVLVLILEGQVLVLVLGGSVLVNITADMTSHLNDSQQQLKCFNIIEHDSFGIVGTIVLYLSQIDILNDETK